MPVVLVKELAHDSAFLIGVARGCKEDVVLFNRLRGQKTHQTVFLSQSKWVTPITFLAKILGHV
jgi:hypothetical protein